ncbi:MAG: SBBP repeat-containing protein [Phycisphaeraceae bacterium]|nr:SBBP repeat-containing protein [Phycisphaerales bacterium]MCB9859743.1 SBBP repeat-containing protein [Phycisphaeraceae bacterium]
MKHHHIPLLIVLGTTSFCFADPFEFEWGYHYNFDDRTELNNICAAPNGDIYVCGKTSRGKFGPFGVIFEGQVISRIDPTGAVVWSRVYNDIFEEAEVYSWGIASDDLGNAYIGGDAPSTIPGVGGHGINIAKYDSDGNQMWYSEIASGIHDVFSDIDIDSAGNVYFVGSTRGNLPAHIGDFDVVIGSLDADGALRWTRQFGSVELDFGGEIKVDPSGNIFVAGLTRGDFVGTSHGAQDALLAKYDSDGTLLWQTQLGTPESENYGNIALDSTGNVYLAGAVSGDISVMKLDPTGTPIWISTFGSADMDAVWEIEIDSNDTLYLAGSYAGASNSGDAFVAQLDNNGNQLWLHSVGSAQIDVARGLFLDEMNNIYIAGVTYGNLFAPSMMSGPDGFIAKFAPDVCYADCDSDGDLDIVDYICFGNAYAAQDPYADCDGSGSLNVFDYICFGNAYAAGCP